MARRLNFGTPAPDQTISPSLSPQPVAANPIVAQPTYTATPIANAKPLTIDEIGQFGARSLNQLADVTNRITGAAKTSDMDEVGKLLTDTIMAAKGYDPKNLFKGGLFGFIKAKKDQIVMRFDNVDDSVDRLVGQIDQRINLFRQRVRDLEQLAVQNRDFHDSLFSDIDELIERADWMDANAPDIDPNDPMSANVRQEWITVATFARKRGDDLRRAQILAQQQQAQIAQMAQNSNALVLKFSDVKTTTIPAMKQTFALYVLNLEQKKGAEFSEAVDDLNDDILKKNASMLGQNTVAINKALTRSNVSMDALKANQDSIIKSLEDVERIRNEMKARIATEAPKIEEMSAELARRLSQKTI